MNNPIESWIYQVGISHSGSEKTAKRYRLNLERFCGSVGKTAEEIIQDYDKLPEKTFKRFYAQAVVCHLAELGRNHQSSGSVSNALNSVRSFFKYHSLPLNFLPAVRVEIENHNRDITGEEIEETLKDAECRERALFCLIAQAGLRPDTLTKLKVRDVERILDEETPIPCLVKVERNATKGKYKEYFTFAPKESVTYLKEYLRTRKLPLTQDSFLFAMYEDETKPVRPGVFSHLFRRIVLKLRDQNVLSFNDNRKQLRVESRDHKVLRNVVTRNELRLYNLRKFFRKYAGQAGPDYVNFWMGHTSALGVDLHYFSRDVEQHRQIFKDKAMPFLRLETHTPTETEKEIEELRTQLGTLSGKLQEKDKEIKELRDMLQPLAEIVKLANIRGQLNLVVHEPTPEEIETMKEEIEEYEQRNRAKKPQE